MSQGSFMTLDRKHMTYVFRTKAAMGVCSAGAARHTSHLLRVRVKL